VGDRNASLFFQKLGRGRKKEEGGDKNTTKTPKKKMKGPCQGRDESKTDKCNAVSREGPGTAKDTVKKRAS